MALAESPEVNALVGEWGYEREGGFACVLRLKPDGTFNGRVGDTARQIDFEGNWERKGDRILYVYRTPRPGSKDEDKIIELTADELVTEDLGHNVQRYRRLSAASKKPSQPPPTARAVTPPAAQEPRQP